MPAYNAEQTIDDSIQSIINQTWKHWELVLIIDCKSVDKTGLIAESYAKNESRIRLVQNLPKGGCAYNRNHALMLARGEFIAFLDSDDLWLPKKLELQVNFMQRLGCDLSYTGYSQIDSSGNPLPYIVCPPRTLSYSDMLGENLIGCLTAMVRRSRFPKIEFIDYLHEDYILWLRLLRETTAQGLPETLATYRVSPSSRSGNKLRSAWKRWLILRRFEKLPFETACGAYCHYIWQAVKRRAVSRFKIN